MDWKAAVPPPIAGLWPYPAKAEVRRSTQPGNTGYLVVPSVRRARYLVPIDVAGAERMFARHGGSRLERLARRTWRRAYRSRVLTRLPVTRLSVEAEPDGIESYLAGAVGEPVQIGVLLGPPRANRKPVVQCFSKSGETIAFAKLGLTPLSAALLDAEASALSLLQSKPTVTFAAPALLHHGTWKGIPVLVQRALSLAQTGSGGRAAPVDVMAEVASLTGIDHARLDHSAFLARVAPPETESWNGIDVRVFTQLHEALVDPAPIAFGCWHGDFGPWNMARDGRSTEVWDWERFASDVPVGLDAAHFQAQRGFAANTEPAVAWRRITADVEAVLAALSADKTTAPTVGAAYLLEIVTRYRIDAGSEPTAALRRRMTWLVAVAGIAVAEIQESRT